MATPDTASAGLGVEDDAEPIAVVAPQVWVRPDPSVLPVPGDPGRLLESRDPMPPGRSTE